MKIFLKLVILSKDAYKILINWDSLNFHPYMI